MEGGFEKRRERRGRKIVDLALFSQRSQPRKMKGFLLMAKKCGVSLRFPGKKAWKLGRREKFANYCRPNIGEEGKETLGVQRSARIFPALSKRKKIVPRFSEGTGEVG